MPVHSYTYVKQYDNNAAIYKAAGAMSLIRDIYSLLLLSNSPATRDTFDCNKIVIELK